MGFLDLGNWTPSREFLLAPLKTPRDLRLHLERFPRGLDGARIDVWLGEELDQALRLLVETGLVKRAQMLRLSSQRLRDASAAEHFSKVYGTVSLEVARRARQSRRRELFQLFHLAVVKALLLEVERQEQLVFEGSGMEIEGHPGVGSVPERLRRLRRCRPRLRYLVAHDLFSILHSLDRAGRKGRKSLLAVSWPVAEPLLFNPLLQLGDLSREELFLELYPLVLLEPDRFREMEQAVFEPLREWLPPHCVEPPPPLDAEALRALPLRQDKGELAGYAQVEAYLRRVMQAEEYHRGLRCWIDHPPNLMRLLGADEKGRGLWHHAHWPTFQRALVEAIEQGLDGVGLLEPLLASLQLRRIYPDLGRRGAPSLLLDHLLGRRSRQELFGALERLEEIPNRPAYQAVLTEARKRLRQADPVQRRRWMLEALEGFLRLRRDLKLAWEAYRAMDGFRILRSREELALSRANGLLQDFTPGAGESRVPRGHVIVKADLRGSTELIAEMNRMGINPATYFTRNLFQPINTLLRTFGAEKLFLEGDAAILMLADDDAPGRAPLVARACGFAQELIALVAERNRENRLQGLPELELGVGIAYEPGSPTFLFDEGRRITISPAIHRADRLSSSDLPRAFLSRLPGGEAAPRNVEEVQVVETANPVAKGEGVRRYNVNGIELDDAAFRRLREEIALKAIPAERAGGIAGERYHLGRYADDGGKTRWLVVREAPPRIWDGKELVVREDADRGRFREVVATAEEARRIRHAAAGKG